MKRIIKNIIIKILNPIFKAYDEQITNFEQKLTNMEENVRNNNKTIQEFQSIINSHIENYKSYTVNIKNNNNEMMEQRKVIENFSINIKNTNEELKRQSDLISNFTENIRNNNNEMLNQRNLIENFAENIKNNNSEMENNRNKIEKFSENIRNNNKMYSVIVDEYKELIPRVNQNEKVLLQHEKKIQNSLAESCVNINKNANSDRVEKEKKKPNHPMEQIQLDYMDFENYFRGSKEKVKISQKQYLKFFKNKKNVLDLGCGRGEFLELLRDNNINAIGVDIYKDYVDYCNMNGLNVINEDMIAYLEKCKMTDGIFAAQVVEHLNFSELLQFCNLAYDKLEMNSYLVIETPNPTSLATFTNSFYIDATHTKPVHPLALEYYLKRCNFKNIQIIYTESSKMGSKIPLLSGINMDNLEEYNRVMQIVSNLLFGSQDYAIIAQKI